MWRNLLAEFEKTQADYNEFENTAESSLSKILRSLTLSETEETAANLRAVMEARRKFIDVVVGTLSCRVISGNGESFENVPVSRPRMESR